MYNNNNHSRQALKTYDLHPTSIKLIKDGHPWVTTDRFSEKFHPKERFIIASNRNRPFALLIHDPTHKNVRARVWATSGHFQKLMKNFKNDVIVRLRKSFQLRKNKNYFENRNHFYLAFGENDQLPGVFIKYVGGELLIEFYMEFWRTYQDFMIQNVIRSFNEVFKQDISISQIWFQYRSQNKESAKCLDPIATFRRVDVNEFGVNYKVYLGKHYDTGIYTDMAAIRARLKKQFTQADSLLNLYSYTGAFSLYAASLGVKDITSVDMSETYQQWLQENIELNPEIDLSNHKSMTMPALEALAELKEANKKFDCIISDPPSSSNDGNRTTNALSEYQQILPEMYRLMSDNGVIIAFLNTHKITMEKFKNKLKNIIHSNKLPLVLSGNLYLGEDCPYKKGFPEGSYLKGVILKKRNENKHNEGQRNENKHNEGQRSTSQPDRKHNKKKPFQKSKGHSKNYPAGRSESHHDKKNIHHNKLEKEVSPQRNETHEKRTADSNPTMAKPKQVDHQSQQKPANDSTPIINEPKVENTDVQVEKTEKSDTTKPAQETVKKVAKKAAKKVTKKAAKKVTKKAAKKVTKKAAKKVTKKAAKKVTKKAAKKVTKKAAKKVTKKAAKKVTKKAAKKVTKKAAKKVTKKAAKKVTKKAAKKKLS